VGVVFEQTAVKITVNGQLASVTPGTAGQTSFTSRVALATEGPNTLAFTAIDAAGNRTDSSRTVIRDTHAPVVTLNSLPDSATVRADSALTVSGTVTDLTRVTANVNGQPLVIDSVTHAFSQRITLASGMNFVTLTATDAAGNATSVVRQITVDNTPPTLTVTGPAESLITKEVVAHVTGTATANSAVTLTVNGVATTLGSGGAFATDAAIAEGASTITVVATNAAGLSVTATRHVVRDTQAPALGWTAPTDSAVTKENSIVVTGTITDATATSLTVNGTSVVVNATTKAYSTTLPLTTDGEASISLVATDAAGNTSTTTRTVTRDATAPVITVQSPDSGAVTQASTIAVSGSVSDLTKSTLTVNGTPFTIGADGGFTGNVALTSGVNTLTFVARDAAGNQTQTTRTLTRDNDAPVVSVASPSDQVLVKTNTVTVRGTITDASVVTATLNGVPLTIASDRTYQSTIALSEGLNTITLVATDAAGNSTTLTRAVTLDTTAPTLVVSTPANGTTVSADNITVSGTATDQSAVHVTVNGGNAPLTGLGTFSASIALITGSNAIAVIATDSVGNSSTVALAVTRTASHLALPPDPATVATPIDRTVATNIASSTAFLYTGTSPIQTGVATGTIKPFQASVVRGRVLTREGQPLTGVKVAIHQHPELGQTLSRLDGGYDLAVNGGERLTLNYTLDGHLSAQRQFIVPRQHWVNQTDVMLVALDSVVSTIDLSAEEPVARGSVVTDSSGTRRATAMFEQGTQATMRLADGTMRPLTTLAVRSTEYTVGPNGPSAMPGELPPSSAYTYAMEMSVDEAIAAGATTVLFTKPVSIYVENFIGFPVGGIVPVASYDLTRAVWSPETNGRVVKVLSTTGGIAALDVDGSGSAADASALAALGLTDAELRRVGTLYAAGQTLWRYRLSHFTTTDANWPHPLSQADMLPKQQPPRSNDHAMNGGAGGDDGGNAGGGGGGAKEPDKLSCQAGSIIGCERRTLGEEIAVTGTPVSLTYTSERSAGYKADYSFDVALSDGVPDSVLALMSKILVRVTVAGQTTVDTVAAAAGLHKHVTWDGRDAYGRLVQGQARMVIEIGYLYAGSTYGAPVASTSSFGQASGTSLTQPVRTPDVLWQTVLNRPIGSWNNAAVGLGGWSISAHHAYDPTSGVLYLGTGERRSAGNVNPTVVASGTALRPNSIVANPDGSTLIADGNTNQILRIARDGTKSVFAGNGSSAYSGDGGPATAAGMRPTRIARGPDGSVYVADVGAIRFRRIDPQGIITTIAGTGACGTAGDGGPATLATFCDFGALEVGRDGSVYVLEDMTASGKIGTRVRRIGPDGIVTHFAGVMNGDCGYGKAIPCQENVPAINAPMGFPWRLAIQADGSVVIADIGNAVIWKVSPSGVRTRLAGTIQGGGDTGDGGLARDATLRGAGQLAAGTDGSVYVLTNLLVRRVGPDGIITTVAGTGDSCRIGRVPFCPTTLNGNAQQTPFPFITALAVSPDNTLLIGDGTYGTVIRVTKPLPGFDGNDFAVASEDGSELYRFDASGRHLATIDPMTAVTLLRLGYDSNGYLTSMTDAAGNVTSIGRAGNGALQEIVSSYGQRTLFTLGASGALASARAPGGKTVQFGYDASGLMTSRTDAGGGIHQFAYDAAGLLVSDRNADGLVQTLVATPTAVGKMVTVSKGSTERRSYVTESVATGGYRLVRTNTAGLTTTTTAGRADTTTVQKPDGTIVTTVSLPDPRFGMQQPLTTTTVKLPSGLTRNVRAARIVALATMADPLSLTSQTDTVVENGLVSTATFDAVARTMTSRSPEGRSSTATMDSLGRIARSTSAGLATTQLSYDGKGRVERATDAGRATTFGYDAEGLLISITDPIGHVTRLTNDSIGRLLAVQGTTGKFGFSYDSAGNLLTVTPPGRPAHAFSYTAGGMLSTYDLPTVPGVSSTTTSYRYDSDLRLRSIVRPSGDSATSSYDAAGRLFRVADAEGTTSFSYGAATGLLSTVTSSTGVAYALTYDGTLLKSTTLSGGVVSGSIAYGYDGAFRSTSIAVNGASVALSYDKDGLLLSAGALTLTRNAVTGLQALAVVNAVATTYAYDSTGVMASATSSANGIPLYSYQLQRDVLDRIVRKVETINGALTDSRFAYDSAGRLRTVTQDGVAVGEYEYDANGNRTRSTSSVGVELGVVDAQDRLVSYGGATYEYSDAGDLQLMIAGTDTTAYHYDATGALRWMRLPNGTRIDYVIDPLGRRIGKRVNGVFAQGFLYESDLRIAAELTPTGEVRSRFVYGTQVNVPDYIVRDGKTFRLITDHLGSVRLVVDAATGDVQQRLDYDAWGRVTQNSNPGFQPFGFAGGVFDEATGLVRFGVRDYDPNTGRFTTRDPAGFSGGTNAYAYTTHADPINQVDPTGLESIGACNAALLTSYFPGLDLGDVDLHYGWDTSVGSYEAKTVGDQIFLHHPFHYATYDDVAFAALIGHELTHVIQYRTQGMWPGLNNLSFGANYYREWRSRYAKGLSSDESYSVISFELEAYEVGRKIERELRVKFPDGNACHRKKGCDQ
jgi:RHS repeat-associated protein